MLSDVVRLYALHRAEADLGWLVTSGLVSLEAARALPDALRALCAGLAPHYRLLVDSFGIPDYLVAAPIAADWSLYNEGDNRGEVLGVPF